jgi:quinoprotein glucose dehydrogenase
MATTPAAEKRANRNLAFRISAAVIGLIGLYLVIGGIWLISLGGSLYYLLCGAAIIATAPCCSCAGARPLALRVRNRCNLDLGDCRDRFRLVAARPARRHHLPDRALPLPAVHDHPAHCERKGERRRIAGAPLFGALAIAAVVGVTAMFSEYHSIDGELPPAVGAIPANYAGVPDGDWRAYGASPTATNGRR